MTLTIKIPTELEATLRHRFGSELEQRATEDLAVAWFNEGSISSRQVAKLLGLSLFAAHDFLKAKGATAPLTLEELDADFASLRELK